MVTREQVHAGRTKADDGHVDGLRAIAKKLPRHAGVARLQRPEELPRTSKCKRCQPIRFGVGKLPDNDGVGQAEDGAVRANGQAQNEHGRQREHRRPAKDAYGVAEIAHEAVDRGERAHGAHLLLLHARVAESSPRLAAGLFRRSTLGNELIGEQIEMRLHLVPAARALARLPPAPHGYPSTSDGRITRATARVSASHRLASDDSCLRPVRVSR